MASSSSSKNPTAEIPESQDSLHLLSAEEIAIIPPEKSIPCTLPSDQFGPFMTSLSTPKSLRGIRQVCDVPDDVEFSLPTRHESPETGRDGYFVMYEAFLTGCGLFFPIPEIILLFLYDLNLAFPQMCPNMLRYLLCAITVASEAGFSLSRGDLLGLFSVRVVSEGSGYYTIYPIPHRALIGGLPSKDPDWQAKWFFVRINSASVSGLGDMLHRKWANAVGSFS